MRVRRNQETLDDYTARKRKALAKTAPARRKRDKAKAAANAAEAK